MHVPADHRLRSDSHTESRSRAQEHGRAGPQVLGASTAAAQLVDLRHESTVQARLAGLAGQTAGTLRALQLKADASAQTRQLAQMSSRQNDLLQRQAASEDDEPLQAKIGVSQRVGEDEEEPLQGRFEPVQRAAEEDEQPIQGRFDTVQRLAQDEEEPAQLAQQATDNRTGLPDQLKSGVESLSGMSLDNVRVHYNSSQPAQLNALAYAQGTDIHVAPGQEKHLPHEAWHVVQQAQGRVQPTRQMKAGVPVNNDASLESEADAMGARAMQMRAAPVSATAANPPAVDVVQQKNLAQTGWVAGIEDQGQRNLVTDGREVNLYLKSGIGAEDSRPNAMKKAAETNAAVGKTVDDQARASWGKNSNDKWTAPGEAHNSDALNKVDPFFVGVIVPFSHLGQDHQMEFTFQHAKAWTGYVESIYDSTNAATNAVPTMFDNETELGKKGQKGIGEGHYRNLEYSNVHEGADNSNLLGLTAGGGEKNLDAYTKIVGEGARWKCIRNNLGIVQNDSLIYTNDPGTARKTTSKGKFKNFTRPGIRFKDLWKTWSGEFSKAYDIENSEVKAKLQRAQGWFQGSNRFDLKNATPDAKDIQV